MDLIGAVFGAIGLLLTLWSIWYARSQARKITSIHRAEMLSLWATLDRTRILLEQSETITSNKDFIDSGALSRRHIMALPRIYKGLCDEYVRIVEIIVRKSPELTINKIQEWRQSGLLKSDWQEAQFTNLISALN